MDEDDDDDDDDDDEVEDGDDDEEEVGLSYLDKENLEVSLNLFLQTPDTAMQARLYVATFGGGGIVWMLRQLQRRVLGSTIYS